MLGLGGVAGPERALGGVAGQERALGGVAGQEQAQRGGIGRGSTGVAALVLAGVTLASVAVAGCSGFAVPPKKRPHPTFASNPAAVRVADAPALLVQCAIRTA